MRDFFAAIYETFISSYGYDLAKHLAGWNGMNYSDGSLYSKIGIILIVTSLFFSFLFYFFINSPRFSRWYHWVSFLVTVFFINWGVGYYFPWNDYNSGMIASGIVGNISKSDIVMFGFFNGFWSVLAFLIASLICISIAYSFGGGHNTRNTPWRR